MKTAYINGYILSGKEDMTPVGGHALIVNDEKIEAIVPNDQIPPECQTIDLRGKYLYPGLINMHVHIPSSGKPKKGKTDYNAIASLLKFGVARAVVRSMCKNLAAQELLSGTTTIRAVGGVLHFDTELRDKINSGKVAGPRIIACDYAVSVPGGHMTGSVALPASSPEHAASMVEELAKSNVDWIKLMITGGVLDAEVPGEPGVLKMPPEYVKAAVDKAHSLGLKVAAHVESTEGMLVALQNGVDTLEHGGKPAEETMNLFKEKNAVLISTLSPAIPFALMDPRITGNSETDLINGKALYENMAECTRQALAQGITVGLGTDTGCPYVTHYDMWRELFYFTKVCGVSNAFALHTATEVNAKILGLDNVIGTIEPGKDADFVVCEGNPLEDITALREVRLVSSRGRVIAGGAPKRIPEVDEQLDKLMPLFG